MYLKCSLKWWLCGMLAGKKQKLWKERAGMIKEAVAFSNLCDVCWDKLRGVLEDIIMSPTQLCEAWHVFSARGENISKTAGPINKCSKILAHLLKGIQRPCRKMVASRWPDFNRRSRYTNWFLRKKEKSCFVVSRNVSLFIYYFCQKRIIIL